MPRIRRIVKEEYNSYGQFMPPNPWGHDVSVGREMEGGDDEDMQMDLQADLTTNPIKALDERASDITDIAPEIIQRAFNKLGIAQKPRYINGGSMGYAYTDGENIYKVTTDPSEAAEASKLLNKTNKYIADIYDVFQVRMDNLKVKTYIIVLEKLKTDPDKFGELENEVDDIFGRVSNTEVNTMLEFFRDYKNDYDTLYKTKLKQELDKNPEANKYWHQLLLIVAELKQNNIHSLDIHYNNIGYKKNGKLGFFDIGFSDVGTPANVNVIQLENKLLERILSYMPGSDAVSIKKKCQINGNGDGTSTACNQGDIDAIETKPINENDIDGWLESFFKPYREEIRQAIDGYHRSDASDELAQMTHPALAEINAYHGTSNTFDAFSIKKIGSSDGREIGGWGIYFTDDASVAAQYGGKVMEVDLRKGNYLNLDDNMDDELVNFILSRGRKFGLSDDDIAQFESDFNDEGYRYDITNKQVYEWLSHCLGTSKAASLFLSKAGYLGNMMHDRTNPDAMNYIVFDPSTVKILDNNGEENLYELEYVDTTGGDQELVGMDGSVPMPNDSTYIPEGKDQKIEYGVVMLNFKIKEWTKVTSIIDKDDIYDKPTFGIEKNPHVTVLYGFHDKVTANDTKKIIEDIIDVKKPIDVELIEISFFEVKGQDYDVVKFDVKCPILHKLNKALQKLPHTSSFPDYHPHMTISYVKKGCAKKYARKLKKSINLQSNHLVYSTKKDKKTRLNENYQLPVNSLPFSTEIEQAGGKIYSVGGAVRDGLLNKPSKDLDLLITGLPMGDLERILAKYGKVDNVGKSFGIIKLNSPKLGELDIAIPRTEKSNGQGGYQGFDVSSDHTLPIEKDLERRDFTINAMAKDRDGNMIDPYNGQKDLNDKMIRMVNPQAFKDDPLRMIRAIQFAARFGFNIEPNTMAAIKENASRIKEISPERILIEFDKIVTKGHPSVGAKLLAESGLYENIFGAEPNINHAEMEKVKTMGEFIFLLAAGAVKSPAEFFKTNLKGDLDTYNAVRAFELAYSKPVKPNDVQTKLTIFGMYKLYPQSLESPIVPHDIKLNIAEMQKMGMPFSMKDLQINGNDLLAFGYTGQQIGQLFKQLVIDIYSGKLRNNRALLLNYLTPNNPEA